MRTRHLGVVIRRSPDEVYALAADPAHLPSWAAGLAAGEVRSDGDILVVNSPMGEVRVRFAPTNAFGVLDHEVTLPDGTVTLNPLRVLPHPHGSEVVFTLRGADGGADEDDVERDAAAVAEDLDRLRQLLDTAAPSVEDTAQAPARPAEPAEIRMATPADAESLGRLLFDFNTEFGAETPDGPTAAARFEYLLRRDDVLAVLARVGSDIGGENTADIGFAFLTLRPTPLWDGPLAQLEELYVRHDLRGNGVGTALLARAVDEVLSRGSEEILINVDTNDAGARRFYERHGFSDRDPDTGSGMRCYLRQLTVGL